MKGNPFKEGVAQPSQFTAEARHHFREFITQPGFSCVGAHAALNSDGLAIATYDELGSTIAAEALCHDLCEFIQSGAPTQNEYASFAAIFRGPLEITEAAFEQLVWQQLRGINRLDEKLFAWDPKVSSDPDDPRFSFSFGGQAFYVIGMHEQSSRRARRFKWPALIFNPHEQFEQLRADGKWRRMQETIRSREIEFQGSINPMLSEFGERSEARQYSGRAVEENWRAPFAAKNNVDPGNATGGCPFAH